MNAYTGHGEATGGLQAHSIGALYPLDVYGQETPEGTRYGIVDLSRGLWSGPHWTCTQAHEFARCLARARTYDPAYARRWLYAMAEAYAAPVELFCGPCDTVQPHAAGVCCVCGTRDRADRL